MPNESPAVVPMIAYEDGIGALDWLARAFGFRELRRMTTADGRLAHGEMEAGQGLIMLASPTADYECPLKHQEENHQFEGYYWTINLNPLIINVALAAVQNKARVVIHLSGTAPNSEMFGLSVQSH
jgi:uncharacterized glyoxalase superfamily protein PhnB